MTRTAALARAVAWLAVAGGLLLGIPVVLALLVGQPVPHVGEVREAIDLRYLSPALGEKLGACLGWLAWAYLSLLVVAESQAQWQARPSVSLPAAAWLTPAVRRGVAAVALAAALFGRGSTPAPLSLGDLRAATADPAWTLAVESVTATPPPAPETPATAPEPLPTYTVHPGDNAWDLAHDQLGDPTRWREMWALNRDRPQPDGGRWSDPDLIRPGWVLSMPMPAVSTPPAPPVPPVPSPLPAAPFAGPSAAGPPPPSTVPSPPAPEASHGGSPVRAATSGDGHDHGESLPVAPVGLGLAGVGLLVVLERMRRAQSRRRRSGRRPRLPGPGLAEAERRLHSGSAGDARFLDAGLRSLAAALAEAGQEPPAVIGARLGSDGLEVALDSPAPSAPSPWQAGDRPGLWWLPAGTALPEAELMAEVMAPLPALVQLGTDDEGRLVLANLELAGSLSLSGRGAADLLARLAVELGAAGWAELAGVQLVAFGAELAERLERVSFVDSAEADLLADARGWLSARRAALAAAGQASLPAARVAAADPSWAPRILLCRSGSPALAELAGLAAPNSGLVLVVAAALPEARWQLDTDAASVELAGLGRVRLGTGLSLANYNDLLALLEVAADTGDVGTDEPPYDGLPPSPADEAVSPLASTSDPASDNGRRPQAAGHVPEVLVRVLGPISFDGAAEAPSRAKTAELIVYLALHPGGVATETWAAALWPDRRAAQATINSRLTNARSALGRASDGADHVLPAQGQAKLGPGVCTDWQLFALLAADEDPESWAQALGLVRGQPFDGLGGRAGEPAWVVMEGFRAELESSVVDLAERLGERRLGDGDPLRASSAARVGLRASPWDERLYRILMRAAHAEGNLAGVDTAMRDLCAVAEDLEPLDAVHPETTALYEELTGVPARRRLWFPHWTPNMRGHQ